MNLQEREQLVLFLQQLTQAQAIQKDSEADMLIREACARQPDAGYLLVQRAMSLDHVLQATNARVSQLQAELDQARLGARSGFLDTANSWGRPAPTASASGPAVSGLTPGSPVQARAQAPVAATAAPSPWGAGMLGSVAATAAGVVAGSFLFQGIENLMGHHGGAAGSNAGAHAATPPVAENTVVNNYYDGSGPEDAADVADAGTDVGGDDLA